jgi:hypothetical protein
MHIVNNIIVLGYLAPVYYSLHISYQFLCLGPALPLPIVRLVYFRLGNIYLRCDCDAAQASEWLIVQPCHALGARLARARGAPAR